MQNTLHFKDTLIKEARLLSLTKSDCDLFILAQANTLTYQQLAATGLHGISTTGGRLSLKKLTEQGYITGKTLPNTNRVRYFILTAKGKTRLEKIFSSTFLSTKQIDLDRKPPTSQQQLPHRIHTNDLYFAYLSCPYLENLPVWQLETRYQAASEKQQTPRCDGLLETGYCNYYIELDNRTQGDAALENKLSQYMDSDLFLGKNTMKNALVFTLNTEVKSPPIKKPPYSVYRILLKAIRIWRALEAEQNKTIHFSVFCDIVENGSYPYLCLLSGNDKMILRNLCRQYPDISLNDAVLMKKEFLYDTSLQDERASNQDALFLKRLKQKFYSILDNRHYATLHYRIRQGMRLYAIPNHRLADNIPFLFQEEYRLQLWFPQILFHMGLQNLEAWKYNPSRYLSDTGELRFFFYNTFDNTDSSQSVIIFEDIVHDLGGRERVRFFLRKHRKELDCLFILLVSDRKDAVQFMSEMSNILQKPENAYVHICFLDKKADLYQTPAMQNAYFKKEKLWLPTMIDFDDFTGQLSLTERSDLY